MDSTQKQLKRVADGVGMILLSMLMILLLLLMWIAGPLLALTNALGDATAGTAMAELKILAVASAPVFIVAMLLGAIGSGLCLAAPAESRATEFALITLVLQVVAIMTGVSSQLLELPPWLNWMTTVGSNLAPYVAMAFFLLFVRRMAFFIDKDDTAKLALNAMMLTIASIVLITLLYGFSKIVPIRFGAMSVKLSIASGGLALIVLLLGIHMLVHLTMHVRNRFSQRLSVISIISQILILSLAVIMLGIDVKETQSHWMQDRYVSSPAFPKTASIYAATILPILLAGSALVCAGLAVLRYCRSVLQLRRSLIAAVK